MTSKPVICFGQQPCGFFPKRYLFAKIKTARRLQKEIGGEIVFFLPRQRSRSARDDDFPSASQVRRTVRFNFGFANETQKKYSPLYLETIRRGWQAKAAWQLRSYSGNRAGLGERFKSVDADNAADFCLRHVSARWDLLDGIRVMRSSDGASFGPRGVRDR